MADQCLFCKIVSGAIPVEFVAQNDHAVAFRDIEPKAPVHLLIVPKTHISGFHEIGALSPDALAGMLQLVNQAADSQAIGESGYRVLTNAGTDAGQTVFHLHWHLLGGARLGGFA